MIKNKKTELLDTVYKQLVAELRPSEYEYYGPCKDHFDATKITATINLRFYALDKYCTGDNDSKLFKQLEKQATKIIKQVLGRNKITFQCVWSEKTWFPIVFTWERVTRKPRKNIEQAQLAMRTE